MRDVIFYIGLRPCNILMDKRRYLLLISCLRNDCETTRRCSALLEYEDDFIHITTAYGFNSLMCVSIIKRLMFIFMWVLYTNWF